LKSHRDG